MPNCDIVCALDLATLLRSPRKKICPPCNVTEASRPSSTAIGSTSVPIFVDKIKDCRGHQSLHRTMSMTYNAGR